MCDYILGVFSKEESPEEKTDFQNIGPDIQFIGSSRVLGRELINACFSHG